ncbi:MAG: hypothetical protein J1F64_09480 [Oscillospiraceae bacterium]|nr:hypothetical protein [Oscillospiraceae bacterium]
MACFTVPAAEAIVTTIIKKNIDKNPFLKRIGWLSNMLWGGSALLAFEHVWHGEIVPQFPFLTNAASAETAAVMLKEIATSGVAMTLLVTAVWAAMAAAANAIEKRSQSANITVNKAGRPVSRNCSPMQPRR